MFSMKKILILGGAAAHCQVVRRAKEMGIYTIVTDYLSYEDAPAKQIADEYMQIDINDIDALVDFVKKNKVDGVLNFCLDPCALPAFEVASRCGLKTFYTKEQVKVMTDKSLFKETCEKLGLPILESYSIQDVLGGNVSFPVVLKPRIGRGSRGVYICEDADMVLSGVKGLSERIDRVEGYIIEEFAPHESCPFVIIQYIVIAGEPFLVTFADAFHAGKKYGLECYYSCLYSPSPLLDTFMKGDNKLFVNFIERLGIKNGALMFQSFLKDGHFRTIDMALRFMGTGYCEAMKDSIGVDVIEPMISFAVGDNVVASDGIRSGLALYGQRICICKCIMLKPGTVGQINGVEILLSHPQIFGVDIRCHKGMVVPSSGDARQDGGQVFCVIKKNLDEVKRMSEFIETNLVITDSEGNDMMIHTDDLSDYKKSLKKCLK